MARASASFEIAGWDDAVWSDSDGVKLGRATVRKTFSGELEGDSVAEVLTATVGGDPVEYRAIERVTGALGGRRGAFVLSHGAGPESGGTAAPVHVIPGSGTGELAGLSGEGTISHGSLELDYELE
jgi:hypothetical protein